jgi:hypothetical protein
MTLETRTAGALGEGSIDRASEVLFKDGVQLVESIECYTHNMSTFYMCNLL